MREKARGKLNSRKAAMAALAVAIALSWVWMTGPAFALSLAQETFDPLRLEGWNAQTSPDSSSAGFYLFKGPDAEVAAQKPGLLVSGTSTFMVFGEGRSVDGGLYFSRSLIPVDPLSVKRSFAPGQAGAQGLDALAAAGQQQVMRSGQALWQQLAYKQKKWSLTGSYAGVSPDFEGLADVVAKRADAARLASMLGMRQTNLDFTLQPASSMSLTSHYESMENNQQGHKEQGLTKGLQKHVLDWGLGARTKMSLSEEITSQEWNRPDRRSSEEKRITTFNLTQTLGNGLLATVTRQLRDTTASGTRSSLDATQAHIEYKPGARLSLAADWGDKKPDAGDRERTSGMSLSSLLGKGKSAMALTGQWQQKDAGEGNPQRDQTVRLGLKMDKNPLLQLALGYEGLRQQGPKAQKDDRKIDATITSQIGRLGKVVAYMMDETDAGKQIKREHKVRFELAPLSRLSFVGGREQADVSEGQASAQTFGQMLWKIAKPLQPWAKESVQTGILGATDRHGLRNSVGWARVPDSGLEMRFIARTSAPTEARSTQVIGLQTMLGPSAYMKLSLQDTPMEMKDKQETQVPVKRDLVEMGLRVTKRMTLLARGLRERDLTNNKETQTQLLALRAQAGRQLSVAAGYQQVDGEQQAALSYAGLNWKMRPLRPWAQTAAAATLFSDADKYGWRKLPDWANAEGGLSLQVLSRGSQSGPGMLTYFGSFQTMMSPRMYLRLAAQQNPFDDKAKMSAVRRGLCEFGLSAWRKWTIIGRALREEDLQSGLVTKSHMLGLRSALSSRERLETVISVDGQSGPGAVDRRSAGLLYSRELAADHMLSLKATFTDNETGRDDLRWDLAFRKDT
jgi:hypothetical protein